METIITAWPIDRELQTKIGIYHNSTVGSRSVGRVLRQLVENGYTSISSFVENRQDENALVLCIHCRKGVLP